MRITENAYAKINLTLDVLGRRSDGYHELAGVMHTIELCDIVTVTVPNDAQGITVICNEHIPTVNTAYTAAMAFFSEIGEAPCSIIELTKHIPSESGLGGASADAAAVLRALQKAYNYPLSEGSLLDIARTVGADVPFCMKGGCAYATGIGEVLTALPPLDLFVVIVKGVAGVSTKQLFESLDMDNVQALPNERVHMSLEACRTHNNELLFESLFNALEPHAARILPQITLTKQILLQRGAAAASMTGSGSAVFGLFTDEDKAIACSQCLRDEGYFTYFGRTVSSNTDMQ